MKNLLGERIGRFCTCSFGEEIPETYFVVMQQIEDYYFVFFLFYFGGSDKI